MHYASRTGMEVVSLRIGSPFGPLYHSLAAPSSRICHAAAKGVPVNFKGARGGAPHEEDEVGCFYVKDCATAIQLLQMAKQLSHRVYNSGNDAPLNYRESAELVKKIVPASETNRQARQGPRK